MRVRLIRRGEETFQLMAEQGKGKGKKVTSGPIVTRDDLHEKCLKFVKEVRGENAQIDA